MNNNLAAGTVLSYTYDAGSNPKKTRAAVFRSYIQWRHLCEINREFRNIALFYIHQTVTLELLHTSTS